MPELTVADVMDKDPAAARPDDDVRTVIELLRKQELPGVPVIDDDRRVVGIVTEEDLVISDESADLHLPHFINIMGGVIFVDSLKGFDKRIHKAFATNVSELMTPDPITCAPTDSVKDAAKLIAEKHHNRLPVVDSDGRLVGVVTRVDVLAALAAD